MCREDKFHPCGKESPRSSLRRPRYPIPAAAESRYEARAQANVQITNHAMFAPGSRIVPAKATLSLVEFYDGSKHHRFQRSCGREQRPIYFARQLIHFAI